MILTFEPLKHVYGNGNNISVSTLVGTYKNKFDSEYWLKWKAWEHVLYPNEPKEVAKEKFRALRKELKYTFDEMQKRDEGLFRKLGLKYPALVDIVENDIQEQIQQQWLEKNEKSKIDGTAYHDYKEKESLRTGIEKNPFDNKDYPVYKPYTWNDNIKIQELDFANLPEGYYPELILNLGSIFGQADRTWIGPNKEVWIRDFKTNEEIKMNNSFQKMKSFLSHLDDCEFNHYSLQLSLYAYIFQSYGYKVMDLAIDHYNKEIRVPYLEKEVKLMVQEYEMSLLD